MEYILGIVWVAWMAWVLILAAAGAHIDVFLRIGIVVYTILLLTYADSRSRNTA